MKLRTAIHAADKVFIEISRSGNPIRFSVAKKEVNRVIDDYYLDSDFPRLMVRFEDLLYHPEQVFDAIANCSGLLLTEQQQDGVVAAIRTRPTFQYHSNAAKHHGTASHDMIQAMIKYGQERGRTKGFQAADLEFAKKHALDADLMKVFHYTHPKTPRDYNMNR